MSTITWLHLSDLHLKPARKWDEDIVLKTLLVDVRGQIAAGLRPDMVLVSGDIAFSGAPAEYDMARAFFDDLLAAVRLDRERLLVVPGNHDVDRSAVSRGAAAIAAAMTTREAVGEVLDAPADRQLLLRRLDNYAAFVRSYWGTARPLDEPLRAYVQTQELAGRRVAVLGLNSAWLAHGGDDDRGRLVLSERQVRPALDAAAGADLCLALLHHPLDWLQDLDRANSEALLLQSCPFVLHGHLHRTGILNLASPDSAGMVLAAGAAYAGRDFPNCYNAIRLDLAAGRGTIFLRRYSAAQGGFWAPDTLTYRNAPTGEYAFSLPAGLATPARDSSLPSGPTVRGDLEQSIRAAYAIVHDWESELPTADPTTKAHARRQIAKQKELMRGWLVERTALPEGLPEDIAEVAAWLGVGVPMPGQPDSTPPKASVPTQEQAHPAVIPPEDSPDRWPERSRRTTAPGRKQARIRAVEALSLSSLGQAVDRVKRLVGSSMYGAAVELKEGELQALAHMGDLSDPEFQLTAGELGIWYGQALIYTGRTEEAIDLLRRIIVIFEGQPLHETLSFGTWRRNLVLGRAHNHVGYASWMALGYYEVALREFRTAIRCFAAEAEKCRTELATAYDNMGRVYAQIGHRTRAELLVESGRLLRLESHDDYRYALSLNSRALVHLSFGQPDRALALGKEALAIFKEQIPHHGERGYGLALLTMGQAQRYLGSCWQYSRPGARGAYLAYLDDAIKTLSAAVDIFGEISEPLRRFQANNELGCAYRERAILGENDPEIAGLAVEHLKRDLDIVKEDYPLLYVDACEDLAQAYFRGGDYRNANVWLKDAEAVIRDYQMHRGETAPASEHYVVDHWQQLGKISMLRGHMEFDALMRRTRAPRKDFPRDFRQAIEHYTLAAGYFGRFLEPPQLGTSSPYGTLYPRAKAQLANHRIFIEQLYSRLVQLGSEDLNYIRELLPDIQEAYRLKENWLDEFYDDVLGLLLQIRTGRERRLSEDPEQ